MYDFMFFLCDFKYIYPYFICHSYNDEFTGKNSPEKVLKATYSVNRIQPNCYAYALSLMYVNQLVSF